jgi:hypothetical protein
MCLGLYKQDWKAYVYNNVEREIKNSVVLNYINEHFGIRISEMIIISYLIYSSASNMEAICSSETSVSELQMITN